jgi:hypothetical protein
VCDSAPAGWKHQKQQSVYVDGHDTIPGMVLVMPHVEYGCGSRSAAKDLYQAQDGSYSLQLNPWLASNMIAPIMEARFRASSRDGS